MSANKHLLAGHFLTGYLIRGDGIRNGAVLMSVVILVGGVVVLLARVVAAWQGFKPARTVLVFRMLAVLGALGGFMAYLRDQPSLAARQDLVLGGLSASPWVIVMLLERIRNWLLSRRPYRKY